MGWRWPASYAPLSFYPSVPQKMLHRRRENFSIERFDLDPTQRTLQVEIAYEKHVA